MKADLHIHSSASDGRLSAEEIVRLAAEGGVKVMALTDHDSVAGIAPAQQAAQAFPGLQFIPGVEMATDIPQGELHLLGYFIDPSHPLLRSFLERERRSREERAMKMLARLEGMGISVSFQRVQQLTKGESLGRPHIAQALVEAGCALNIRDAFRKYIGRSRPAYIPRLKFKPEEIIQLIVQVGGLPVIAHPIGIGVAEAELEELARQLQGEGVVGLEAYYNDYPPYVREGLVRLAHRLGLIPLGGSDYHGLEGADTPIGGVDIPEKEITRFLNLAKERVRAPEPPQRKGMEFGATL